MSQDIVLQLASYQIVDPSLNAGLLYPNVNVISNSEWIVSLTEDITINQLDTLVLKQGYLDTRQTNSGSIVIAEDIELSLTYYFYEMLPPDMWSQTVGTGASSTINYQLVAAPYTSNLVGGWGNNYAFNDINGNPITCIDAHLLDYRYDQSGKITNVAGTNQSLGFEIPMIYTSPPQGAAGATSTFAQSTPVTKTWNYILAAGAYTYDELALTITTAMAQMPNPLNTANIFDPTPNNTGNSFLRSDVTLAFGSRESVADPLANFQPMGVSNVLCEFLADQRIPYNLLNVDFSGCSLTNPFTMVNGTTFFDRANYATSDAWQYVSVFNQQTIGASEISLTYNDGASQFQFDYTHTPIQALGQRVAPQGGNQPASSDTGVPVESVMLVGTMNNINTSLAAVNSIFAPSANLNMCRYTKQSGIIFQSMQPTSFWQDILGFNVANMCVTPQQIVNNEITFQQFKTLTTEGFLGQVNNIDFTGYITKPPPTTTQSYPYIPFGACGAPTGSGVATNISIYQQLVMNTYAKRSAGVPDTTYPFTFSNIATIPITADEPPLGSLDSTGHSLVEITGYQSKLIGSQDTFQVKGIISNYYQSQGAFTTQPFEDSARYTHIGEPYVFNQLRVRILDPFTMSNLQGLGSNNCIYLQLTKNYTEAEIAQIQT